MKDIKRVAQKKENGKWVDTHIENDWTLVNTALMEDLIHKKLHKCTYITKITDKPNYDGTREIIVYYKYDMRNVYTVEA